MNQVGFRYSLADEKHVRAQPAQVGLAATSMKLSLAFAAMVAIAACSGGGGSEAAANPPVGGGPTATPTAGPTGSPTSTPTATPTAGPTSSPSPSPVPTPTQPPSPVAACSGVAPPITAGPSLPPASQSIDNPILFVTQAPSGDAFAGRMATFGNHLPQDPGSPTGKGVLRGGDLMIRYPDGSVRNLTTEAGLSNLAVREPSVHWQAQKAVFSMVVGNSSWQLYEVSGLAKGQRATICKLAGQPPYNNVSPVYTVDDQVLFGSDVPRFAHLYPMLDEYESTVSLTGFYLLNPAAATFRGLNKTPSGAFTPTIDSFGRVVFTRWDHLVQDQQAERDNAFNTASEAAGAARIARSEVFPECRFCGAQSTPYGPVNQHQFNLFQPWMMNQDGTAELTLNHMGRHDYSLGSAMTRSFTDDPALQDAPNLANVANKYRVGVDSGVFQIKEDPRSPGTYYGAHAAEFASFGAGPIVRFAAPPNFNADQIQLTSLTSGNGRFRDVLPLATGAMVAAYSASGQVNQNAAFRLTALTRSAAGDISVGATLTPGVVKGGVTLWELEPAEVVARARPSGRIADGLDAAAKQVLAEESVTEAELTAWMRSNNLALIVTNNQTTRDRSDLQQPYNLEVPGGARSVVNNGKVYQISHFQIIEGQQVRGYAANGGEGRRTIGQPAKFAQGKNAPNAAGPAGSVKISTDGSTAAFVEANRALAWQTTDAAGVPIVRERVWVTMQPGEARTCAGCHGVNTRDQLGQPVAANKPEALRELLRHWKTLPKN
ncbi:MAG: hypothetical protein ACRCV9_20510 [Burkholderiaceae bacterium]